MSLGALQTIYDLVMSSYLQKLDIEKKLQRLKISWSFPETSFTLYLDDIVYKVKS